MTEYELNILRSEQVLDSLDIAIHILNEYKHHSIGQPIALLYKSNKEIKLLLAIGKKEGGGDSSYYEIINKDANIESHSRYISSHNVDEKTYSDVGAIFQGTTLEDIYRETDNGDFSKLFDYIFFRDKATNPLISNPEIEYFYLKDYKDQSVINIKGIPHKEDLLYSISRGNVSHGTKGDDQPYAGEYETFIKVYDEEGELVRWDNMITGYSYTIRLYVIFNIGDNQPLNSDDRNYSSVCTITMLYKDIHITIGDSIFGYVGMVYDNVVGFKTKIWSSLSQNQREDIITSLISTPEYKYSLRQLNNQIIVSGKGTINDADTNKGRLVILIPKNLQSKLIVEQNRAGVFVPWVMDISMDITIDGIDYVAYMAASQYAIMTQNNVYRVTVEK